MAVGPSEPCYSVDRGKNSLNCFSLKMLSTSYKLVGLISRILWWLSHKTGDKIKCFFVFDCASRNCLLFCVVSLHSGRVTSSLWWMYWLLSLNTNIDLVIWRCRTVRGIDQELLFVDHRLKRLHVHQKKETFRASHWVSHSFQVSWNVSSCLFFWQLNKISLNVAIKVRQKISGNLPAVSPSCVFLPFVWLFSPFLPISQHFRSLLGMMQPYSNYTDNYTHTHTCAHMNRVLKPDQTNIWW